MLKKTILRQKTSKLGVPPAPQEGQKRHRGKFRRENKISVGSQIRCTRQRKNTYRRKKKCLKRRSRKQRKKSIQKLITNERVEIVKKTRWTEASVINRIETIYRFIAYWRKTKRHNAALYLDSIRSWYYFERAKHLEFHDLCTDIESLQNLQSLLGIGLKFYPAPQFTYNNSNKTPKRCKIELYLKTYHSGVEGNGNYNSCMYVPSTWMSYLG